jgi:hypothetical protein
MKDYIVSRLKTFTFSWAHFCQPGAAWFSAKSLNVTLSESAGLAVPLSITRPQSTIPRRNRQRVFNNMLSSMLEWIN